MTVNTDIRNTFNRHAAEYECEAKIQHEIGERLFERLMYLKKSPRYVLDLGCGPGVFSQRLQALYPKARIVGLDLAYHMLKQARQKQRWRHRWDVVNADMLHLPFERGVFDLVFANQVIHWSYPLENVFSELNRVMAHDACLMFSTLGPDTFQELKKAFHTVDRCAHVNEFVDMHVVGDALLKEYFVDPVVDMEYLTAHYASVHDLLSALKAQGVRNIHPERPSGLMGKTTWNKFLHNMQEQTTCDGRMPLTYEVVYGHAWKGTQRRSGDGVEVSVSLNSLKKHL